MSPVTVRNREPKPTLHDTFSPDSRPSTNHRTPTTPALDWKKFAATERENILHDPETGQALKVVNSWNQLLDVVERLRNGESVRVRVGHELADDDRADLKRFLGRLKERPIAESLAELATRVPEGFEEAYDFRALGLNLTMIRTWADFGPVMDRLEQNQPVYVRIPDSLPEDVRKEMKAFVIDLHKRPLAESIQALSEKTDISMSTGKRKHVQVTARAELTAERDSIVAAFEKIQEIAERKCNDRIALVLTVAAEQGDAALTGLVQSLRAAGSAETTSSSELPSFVKTRTVPSYTAPGGRHPGQASAEESPHAAAENNLAENDSLSSPGSNEATPVGRRWFGLGRVRDAVNALAGSVISLFGSRTALKDEPVTSVSEAVGNEASGGLSEAGDSEPAAESDRPDSPAAEQQVAPPVEVDANEPAHEDDELGRLPDDAPSFIRTDIIEVVNGSEITIDKPYVSADGNIAALCMRGSRVGKQRDHHEDGLLIFGDNAVVVDGMGGQGGGDVATRGTVKSIRESLEKDGSMLPGIQAAPSHLSELLAAGEGVREMGAAYLAFSLVESTGEATWYNQGDVKLQILGPDGERVMLTKGHSLFEELVNLGHAPEKIDPKFHHTLCNYVAAVGAIEGGQPEPTPGRQTLEWGSRVLIYSDGLEKRVPPEEIEKLSAQHKSAEGLLKALYELVQERASTGTKGEDNITIYIRDYR